jgi:hypothetical protein
VIHFFAEGSNRDKQVRTQQGALFLEKPFYRPLTHL